MSRKKLIQSIGLSVPHPPKLQQGCNVGSSIKANTFSGFGHQLFGKISDEDATAAFDEFSKSFEESSEESTDESTEESTDES